MSAICVLAPAVIAGWPAISAAVAGAAAALGMSIAREAQHAAAAQVDSSAAVDVEVENSEVISESLAGQEEIVLLHEDVRVRVYRGERGQCCVSAEGRGRSCAELRAIAEQVVGKITQMFAYNKVMTELKSRGFTVLQEEVTDDESVRIHVRRSVG